MLAMKEQDFYNTTPRTFRNILNGYLSNHREKMELHRELVIMSILPSLDKATRNKPFTELYPLPWEKKAKKGKARKKMTPEEVQQFLKQQEKKKPVSEGTPNPEG